MLQDNKVKQTGMNFRYLSCQIQRKKIKNLNLNELKNNKFELIKDV